MWLKRSLRSHHDRLFVCLGPQTLSLEGALELDEEVRAAESRGERTPHHQFSATRFRQPALNEGKLKPAPYRKGKPMLPENVPGPRPDAIIRRQTIGGGESPLTPPRRPEPDIEAPLSAVPSPMHSLKEQPSSTNFITPYTSPRAAALADFDEHGVTQTSMFDAQDEDDGSEYDAEDNDRDLDMAVEDLLQDEHSRTAVNAVSESFSAVRRTTLLGQRRHSSGEQSLDEPAMKLHTFTNRDLDADASDKEDQQVKHTCIDYTYLSDLFVALVRLIIAALAGNSCHIAHFGAATPAASNYTSLTSLCFSVLCCCCASAWYARWTRASTGRQGAQTHN
jgi:hypothetical protein